MTSRPLVALALLSLTLPLAGCRAQAAETSAPSKPNRGSREAIVRLEVGDDASSVVAVHRDGSRVLVASAPDRLMTLVETSKSNEWAVIEWTTEDEAQGSLAGSIVTHRCLASVEHRRLIDPAHLGLSRTAHFQFFADTPNGEALLFVDKGKDGTLELAKIGGMIKQKPSKRPR